MKDSKINVTFAGIETGKTVFDDKKPRAIAVGKAGPVWRVIYSSGDRYLLFYGEVPIASDEESVPPRRFTNQLARAEDGKVRIIDGKKHTIAGFGGTAEVRIGQGPGAADGKYMN